MKCSLKEGTFPSQPCGSVSLGVDDDGREEGRKREQGPYSRHESLKNQRS